MPFSDVNSTDGNSHLRTCSLNIRSARNKSAAFQDYVGSSGADVFAITETWFKDIDTAHKVELTPPGFKLVDHARSQRAGGGTALVLWDSM